MNKDAYLALVQRQLPAPELTERLKLSDMWVGIDDDLDESWYFGVRYEARTKVGGVRNGVVPPTSVLTRTLSLFTLGTFWTGRKETLHALEVLAYQYADAGVPVHLDLRSEEARERFASVVHGKMSYEQQ